MGAGRDDDDRRVLVESQALGDPTRLAVFAYVRDAAAPVGVAELTDHFGLNHNAIRQHLARLVDAGLVVGELRPPSGPGRPARHYRPVPGAAERWGAPDPFEELSMMLLELLRTGRPARDVGRDLGRRMAAEERAATDAAVLLEAVTRRLGFEPRRRATGQGVDLVLDRCAFVGPAAAAPEVVCDLHRGIAEGIAESVGGATVTDLVVRPPRRAGCRISISVEA